MNKVLFTFVALAISASALQAQKFFTRSAHIDFFSHTAMEDIKGDNNSATLVLDAANGQIEISCAIKAFEFEKALMQEHFNENYMESNTFPNATFKGKIENMSSISLSKDGSYATKASGTMTMHGVDKVMTVPVTFTVAGGKITGDSKFAVNPNDFKITIPGPVRSKIAEAIDVTVKANLAELKK